MGKGSNASRAQKAANIVSGPSVTVMVKDETTGKTVESMVPTALADKCREIFSHAMHVYFMDGGIKEHTEALEKLQTAPDSLGNQLLAFGKECARTAHSDPGRALSLFDGACAYTESWAKQEALKRGVAKDKASMRDILPNWLQNKTTVKQLLSKWAEPRADAETFNILSTSTNNATKKTADVFGTITAVRKVLAETRAPGRNQVTLAGVTEPTANLDVTFKFLAKVAEGIKGNPSLQNLLAKQLSAFLNAFVAEHITSKKSVEQPAAQEEVTTQEERDAAEQQATVAGTVNADREINKRGGSRSPRAA